MAETIAARVSRIISATFEHAIDVRERAGGTVVMAEAIREVDRIVDEVRAEQGAAAARRLQAARQAKLVAERLGTLEEKARFALGQGRDDLAEAAVAQQVDLEAQVQRLEKVQADARDEETRMTECLHSLNARKTELEDALRTFEQASRDAISEIEGPCANRERKVERAERAFDRAAGGAGALNAARTDAASAAKVGEIDALQRDVTIAERLAGLRRDQRAA